ncbi:MAG: YraN family protein [Clostridia bacterium]|nr:YraN family protein [Clostridia bacterium]
MNRNQVDHISVGSRGEDIAAMYLEQNGYRILHRNYRHEHLELDIIATDDTVIVFCEVKTRSVAPMAAAAYGRPSRAVNLQKQKNLSLAARAYVKEYPQSGKRLRFDVIEVYLRRGCTGTSHTDILKVHHIRNAFHVTPLY